jgi:hypothetical protein
MQHYQDESERRIGRVRVTRRAPTSALAPSQHPLDAMVLAAHCRP